MTSGISARETTIVGLFEPEVPLTPLMDRLRQKGFDDASLELISPYPLPPDLLGGDQRVGLVPITLTAGVIGIGVGLFFSAGTALLYPLVTGGKPIVSPPVLGVISYETMMLAAIVTTVVAMAVKILRAHPRHALRDPLIDEGLVAVVIRADSDDPRLPELPRVLHQYGAAEVRAL